MECLFKGECQQKSRAITEILMQMAFELGRAYEQIYLDLKLHDVVDFSDIPYGVEKGAQFTIGDVKPEHIAKTRYKDLEGNQKYQRLFEIKAELGDLLKKYA